VSHRDYVAARDHAIRLLEEIRNSPVPATIMIKVGSAQAWSQLAMAAAVDEGPAR
jgi:hypothetical protein